jgi:hypothetical protein
MSENKQIYLKEEEVEHVIAALAGNTSARDLAEAIGRTEDEVVAVIQEMRQGQNPPSEIDLLREQNALLQKQIDELKSRPSGWDKRTRIRVFAAAGAMLLLVLGVWTMMMSTQIRAVPKPPPTPEVAKAAAFAPSADTTDLVPVENATAPAGRPSGPYSSDGVHEVTADAGTGAFIPPPGSATAAPR